jgi:3-dehydroquinate dehydratase II
MAQHRSIFILNGPNLNLLGIREPEIYGRDTLSDIEAACRAAVKPHKIDIEFRQTNSESQMIDWIQEARERAAAIIINPAGFSFTSVAVLDALQMCSCPIVEVHLSNIHRRESFRHRSYVSLAAKGVICGLGADGYVLAAQHLARIIGQPVAGD